MTQTVNGPARLKWVPPPRFGHHSHTTNGQGFFNTPLRFWGAVCAMFALFALFITYSTDNPASLEDFRAKEDSSSVITKSVQAAQRQILSQEVSLADMERMGQVTEVRKNDYQPQDGEESDDSEERQDQTDPETASAEASAAQTDLMSNEQYPVYELPKGGAALNQVQEEISAADIPQQKQESAEQMEEEERKQSLEDEDIFEDPSEYKNAPIIQAMAESSSIRYREIVLQHERYYRSHPSRLYVPRLKKTAKLTITQFYERFVKHTQPVIIPFEAMRHLGFKTRSYTLDELLEMYPNYKRTFVYKYGSPGPGELDLGPAVWALKQGDALRKSATGRNFPRNTKISLEKLSKLGVQYPPYVLPGTPMLAPSLWFATVTSSTKLHSDCCDNYAMMISGTKRWTIAPPNEARILTPACFGGLCWVKKLEHPDEHAVGSKQQELADKLQKVTFDLRPNEMLYLPTGWFHHVENVGPTIMINFWTKGGPGFLKFLDGSVLSTLADLEKQENAQRS